MDCVFICFRGTQSNNIGDCVTNLSIGKTGQSFGHVHAGMMDRVNNFHFSFIQELLNKQKKVVITGHSLGGACATLLAVKFLAQCKSIENMREMLFCVTFGSPLVGAQSLRDFMFPFMGIFHNYVMDNDIVPLLLALVEGYARGFSE